MSQNSGICSVSEYLGRVGAFTEELNENLKPLGYIVLRQ